MTAREQWRKVPAKLRTEVIETFVYNLWGRDQYAYDLAAAVLREAVRKPKPRKRVKR